jgi:hypothetical protein
VPTPTLAAEELVLVAVPDKGLTVPGKKRIFYRVISGDSDLVDCALLQGEGQRICCAGITSIQRRRWRPRWCWICGWIRTLIPRRWCWWTRRGCAW